MTFVLHYHNNWYCEHTDEERANSPKECIINANFKLQDLLYSGKIDEIEYAGVGRADLRANAPRNTINILDRCVFNKNCPLEAIEYIVSRCPDLISDTTFKTIDFIPGYGYGPKRAKDIRAILHKYDICDDVDMCGICFSSREKHKFCKDICVCTTPYHYDCIAKTIKTTKMTCCTVCKTSYKLAEPYYVYRDTVQPIFFPFSNIYPMPINNGKMIYSEDLKDSVSQLHLAILYLQVERCRDLLKRFTNEEFREFYNTLEDRHCGYINYKDGVFSIETNMPSNAPRIYNESKYKDIEDILNAKSRAEV